MHPTYAAVSANDKPSTRQLPPINPSAHDEVQFDIFKQRREMNLLSRLVAEGFPCVQLVEQQRMVSPLLHLCV